MSNEITIVSQNVPSISGADNDERLIDLWLHGRSQMTQRVYQSDIECFLRHAQKCFGSAGIGETGLRR